MDSNIWDSMQGDGRECSPLTPASGTDEKPNNQVHNNDHDVPVCSVLNTVIDYVMKPPTSLESEDLHKAQQTKNALLVPVLRVFGPILRRSLGNDRVVTGLYQYPPIQSACLYIHGAYPYLLARPCVAGPDGSIHQKSRNVLTQRDHLDWDDPDAVERFLPVLQKNLEESIQTLRQGFSDKESINSTSSRPVSSTSSDRPPAVVRRLSVVMGRGFYTYCPGPPAPFVRVEYYNPSDRWKVKRALEKGLDSMPSFYHPDPFQYDPFGRTERPKQRTRAPDLQEDISDDNESDGDESAEVPEHLQFHCYEAHIPYTMQFFKDWNLSGMSYIHISHAWFRDPLPLSFRNHYHKPYMEACDDDRKRVPQDYLFLRSNTSADLKWPVMENDSQEGSCDDRVVEDQRVVKSRHTGPSSQDQANPSQSSSITEDGYEANAELIKAQHPPPSKETSCDVELDISVDCILNVRDVMREMPKDKEERNRVHWRAVPSLREIWKQERLRMSKLLPPADDFLSAATLHADDPPVFTLCVKGNDVPIPGAQLAVEGMKRLLNVSEGLEENFRRAMSQIVERYSVKVDWIDERIKTSCVVTPGAARTSGSNKTILTPTFEETEDALRALGSGFKEKDESDGHDEKCSPGSVEHLDLSQWRKEQERISLNVEDEVARKREVKFLESAAHYYDPAKRSSKLQPVDDFLLSQRLERGESIVDGPFLSVDDFIDPETLRPYEVIDDDDSVLSGYDEEDRLTQEDDVERELSELATQTLNLGEEGSNCDAAFSQEEYESGEGVINDDYSSNNRMSPIPSEELLADPVEQSFLTEEFLTDLTPHSDHEEERKIAALKRLPPFRKDIATSAVLTGLLPMPSTKKGAPDWLKHLSEYDVQRKKWSVRGPRFSAKSIVVGHMALTRRPPSRKSVAQWARKRFCAAQADEQGPSRKKVKVNNEASGAGKSQLVIDENSGKLVASNPAAGNDSQGKQVEEVNWYPGQMLLSQPEEGQETEEQGTEMPDKLDGNSQDDLRSILSRTRSGHDELGSSLSKTTPQSSIPCGEVALDGLGNQGGKLWVAGGGQLKAKTRPSQNPLSLNQQARGPGGDDVIYLPTPLTLMVVEVHVQCRTGRAGINDSKKIAMVPDPEKDKVAAVVFIVARDPGGGDSLEYLERGCIFVPVENEFGKSVCHARRAKTAESLRRAVPGHTMGVSAPLCTECVPDERTLLLRLASKVRGRDPDMLLSWDTQAAGIGYLVERGAALGRQTHQGKENSPIDMARLLGRTHGKNGRAASSEMLQAFEEKSTNDTSPDRKRKEQWKGSGLGSEWDERVGAGAAASSIAGRLIFAAWKLVAEEVKHANVSYQPAVVSAVLGRRIPHHDDMVLTDWYGNESGRERWRVVQQRLVTAMASLLLFDALDLIGRAGEAARLSGVEFSQSFPGIRGSQYKVEGVLLRALQSLNSDERGHKRGKMGKGMTPSSDSVSSSTKSQTQSPWKMRRQQHGGDQHNLRDSSLPQHCLTDRAYFFYSPSLRDTDRQEALEVQALTLEPESAHYEDPVVVCDFTALYPSLIIAYNLCYSTCAGRLEYHSTRSEMRIQGRTTGKLGPFQYGEGRTATVLKHHMKSLTSGDSGKDRMYAVPTGTLFVSESVVKGVLPQVLDELLSTRAMLKKAAKEYKQLVPDLSPSILRQLEARQLALKYVANVTYGYTSATFSGRCAMPLLADSIVECGRRTLKNAINLANSWGSHKDNKWAGCKVLYGDTDSVFVRLPGRSVREAFQFGEEFCKAVTAQNPPPVQLKLEKVYLGSILQTKKKYTGMKYESPHQSKPTFEAKGIETVRRDQCALTHKVLRNSLITLFCKGPAAVKKYLFRQWTLILSRELPVSDFILTGRVRSKYRGGGVGPVQAVLARRLAEADPGRVVRHKQRIAYVIVATPGRNFRLRDGVMTPNELLEQWDAFVLNTSYYITKHVNPALQRCLGLAPHRIDVTSWYNSMPKPRCRAHFWPTTLTGSTGTISRFFAASICALCGGKGRVDASQSRVAVCDECRADGAGALAVAYGRLNLAQKEAFKLAQQCATCNGGFEDTSTYAVARHSRRKKRSNSLLGASSSSGVYTPLASCTCIDCPVTYQRHRLRETEYGVVELCKALDHL